MKIVHFSDAFFPNINGVTYSVDQFTQSQAKDNEVRIYAPAYTRGRMMERRGKVDIRRYYSLPIPTYKDAHLTVPDLLDIYKSMSVMDPDIIHFHTPGSLGLVGVLMAKIMNLPLVGTYHTLFSEVLDYVSVRRRLDKYLAAIDKAAAGVGMDLGLLRNGEKNETEESTAQKLTWTVVNRIYNYSDKIVCPSQAIKRELVVRNIDQDKLAVINNGLDIKRFWPKKSYRMGNRILHVGRLGFEKNVDVVIRAFSQIQAQLPRMSLVIAGDGPAKKELEKLAGELNLKNRVKFLGMVRRDKLPGVYRGADIFVTASDMETLGLVVLEAMASGLPVVAVDKYAMKDMVINGSNGFRVMPGDYQAMAEKILKLVASEELRAEMGEKSRKMSEKYSLEEMHVHLEKIYRKLVA